MPYELGEVEGPMALANEDVVRSLTSLRQHRKNGNRAPHKPLLVLMAIGQLVSTGSSELAFSEVEDQLGRLIKEYVPTSTPVQQTAAYPFWRLANDKVWALDREVPSDSPKQLAGVRGQLLPTIEQALLSDPATLREVVATLLADQFSPTLHEDVLASVGLDALDYSPAVVSPGRTRRSAEWRRRILQDWEETCAFCGFDGSMGGSPVGIEAAHVRWFNFDGPDAPDNGMALCSLHHKLFDRGAVGLTVDHEIKVSRGYRATSPRGRDIYNLVGVGLNPRPGTALPSLSHIQWHDREVFHGPAIG